MILVTQRKRFDPLHTTIPSKEMTYNETLTLLKDCKHPLDQIEIARFCNQEEGDYFFTDHDYEYRITICK